MFRLLLIICALGAALTACGDEATDGAPADIALTDSGPVVDTAPDAADTAARVCEPGKTYCVSLSEAARCDAVGSGPAETTACVGAEACEPLTGTCRPTLCEPNARQCLTLGQFQTCRPDGSAWGDPIACEEPSFCTEGACRICPPSAVECTSATGFRECTTDGSAWLPDATCGDDERCVAGHGCVDCELTRECPTTAAAREYCASELIAHDVTTPCAAGQTCTDGTCLTCPPNAFECLSESTYRTCSADGQIWSEEAGCGEEHICFEGQCVAYACVPQVLLFVDQSGSMSSHWTSVATSVEALVEANPTIRFGLMSFPNGDGFSCNVQPQLQVPFGQGNAAAFASWFDLNPPNGGTPLADGLEAVSGNAETIFSGYSGAVVVLSDGQDSCYNGADPIKVALAQSVSSMFIRWGIGTYAIGYSFGGNPEELDTIANNGGTGVEGHIAAGDEDELLSAFAEVINDFKQCNFDTNETPGQ